MQLQSYVYHLQMLFLSDNKAVFAPVNYKTQVNMISKMGDNDLIVVIDTSENMMQVETVSKLTKACNDSCCPKLRLGVSNGDLVGISSDENIIFGNETTCLQGLRILKFLETATYACSKLD